MAMGATGKKNLEANILSRKTHKNTALLYELAFTVMRSVSGQSCEDGWVTLPP